jgi:hypothetical protein
MRFILRFLPFLVDEVAGCRLPHAELRLCIRFLGAILLSSILSTLVTVCKGIASGKNGVTRSDRPTLLSCQA